MIRSGNSNLSTRGDSIPAIPSNRHSQVVMARRRSAQDGEALAELAAGIDEEFVLFELGSELRQEWTADCCPAARQLERSSGRGLDPA
jgi:hypothetical protein